MECSYFKILQQKLLAKKKGSVDDLFHIAALLFGFGVSLVVASKLLDSLMQNQFFAGKAPMQSAAQALSILDYGMIFLTVGLFVSSIILAAYIPANRIYLPISLLTLVIAVFTSAQLANAYTVIASTQAFQAVTDTLPWATRILYNFPYLIGIGGFLIILAMYTRDSGGGTRVAR
ncbi:hypothetical protein SAMN05443574_14013 [Haloarcula vallismortis]|uniref:Uncharacterized protein n=2 Tax=Haloarcula vallismortis TaxID=28442 RepID=M0JAZ0_HALVA|nr:hypothetical protein [Haloarcula vallismortis]EMA06151.1 hypothetical protein C437_12211 [Haloarcula vallismortis ATCC 29715]SDX38313.1 hypothetical protein SAMN05443574_14013 [Haloarcula vallismortis]